MSAYRSPFAGRPSGVLRTCRLLGRSRSGLSARHPGVPLYFQDSIFPATRRVRQELLPKLRGPGVEWGCQVYLPTPSERLVAELAENSCTYLYTGIESGSDDILRAIGKTGLTRVLILERLDWFGRHGVRAGLSLMFGVLAEDGELLETEDTVTDTLSLAHELHERGVPVAGIYPNVMMILPRTRPAERLQATGCELNDYTMPRVSDLEGLEVGAVGYNFASLPRKLGRSSCLLQAVRAAVTELATLRA